MLSPTPARADGLARVGCARSRLRAVAVAGGRVRRRSARRAAARSDAEQRQDYDRAVVEYTKALRAQPDDRTRGSRSSARSCAPSQDHFTRGRRLAATGKLDEALVELQVAAELNPTQRRHRRRAARARATSCAPRSPSRAKARPSCRRSSSARAICRRRDSTCRRTSSCRRRSPSATRAAATCSPRSAASRTSASSSTPRSARRRSPSICATPRSTTR